MQINLIFNDNVHILCLSCNIKKSNTTSKLTKDKLKQASLKLFSIVSSVTSMCMLKQFLTVAQHQSGTINALLGPLLNNTEVYWTPLISITSHTIAGYNY